MEKFHIFMAHPLPGKGYAEPDEMGSAYKYMGVVEDTSTAAVAQKVITMWGGFEAGSWCFVAPEHGDGSGPRFFRVTEEKRRYGVMKA